MNVNTIKCNQLSYFGQHNLELHYMDTDSLLFSIKPIKGLNENLEHFEEDFNFSELDLSNEL